MPVLLQCTLRLTCLPSCLAMHLLCFCRRQQNVDETLAELRGKGLTVSGMVCHVGSAQQRQALVDRTIQVMLITTAPLHSH